MSQNKTFINVIHPIRDNSDFPVNTIPLLSKQNDISITMTMLKEIFQTSLVKFLEITRISKKSSFIDQKQTITQLILTNTLVINQSDTGNVKSNVRINEFITTMLDSIQGQTGKHRSLTTTGQTKKQRDCQRENLQT